VLVPSGFNGDMAKFKQQAKNIFKEFAKHRPLDAANNPGLNVFYVGAESDLDDGGNQCKYNCDGQTDRLLCCTNWGFHTLADQHCGEGLTRNLLIVHNDMKYGGSGGTNIGATSINLLSPLIAIHEIGHSLFGLRDEYSYGSGVPGTLNCQPAGCPGFADLKNAPGWWQDDSQGVGCQPGCKAGSNAFVSSINLMDKMNKPFGATNERITCCKFLFHGFTPDYCAAFTQNGLDLTKYCTDNVWKGKTPVALELVEVGSQAHLMARSQDPIGATSVFVADPVEWLAEAGPETGEWLCKQTEQSMAPGLYATEAVKGEQGDGQENDGTWVTNAEADDGHDVTVDVLDRNNLVVRTLKFHSNEAIEIPPKDPTDSGVGDGEFQDSARKIPRKNFRLILNSGETCTFAGNSEQSLSEQWSEQE